MKQYKTVTATHHSKFTNLLNKEAKEGAILKIAHIFKNGISWSDERVFYALLEIECDEPLPEIKEELKNKTLTLKKK